MADLKEIQINGVVYNFKDTTARTQVGTGTPTIVDLVADMVDITKPYLYVGSETGYTAGDWYYYDGTDWVSGGTYGADGGVNTNARNILKYILQRVAYTESGMDTYVNALYQALASSGSSGGGGSDDPTVTSYMIMNALTHVTNSNDATGCDAGDSYSATLTADEGYLLKTITVTMGGTDVTSTVYSQGTITIDEVTGDVIITATAEAPTLLYNWDFTTSLTDTIAGKVATISGATQTSEGLSFTAASQYAQLGSIYAPGRIIEIDFGTVSLQVPHNTSNIIALGFATSASKTTSEVGLLMKRQASPYGWGMHTSAGWSLFISGRTATENNYFSEKTMKFEFDNDGFATIFADGTSLSTADVSIPANNSYVIIGSSATAPNGSQFYDAIITGLRVYG